MPGEINKQYESMTSIRDQWLNDAERAAELTVTGLRVKGNETAGKLSNRSGTSRGIRSYTSIGANGVSTLTNSLLTLLYPNDFRWFRLEIDIDQSEQLIEAGLFEDTDAIDEAMRNIEDRMLERMESHGLRSQLREFFKRNLVEGNNVFQLYAKPDGQTALRLIPLRNVVVSRFNGDVTRIIIRDEIQTSVGNEVKTVELFTEVDYVKGQVWQLQTGGQRKNAKKVSANPNHYIVVSPSVATVDDYADGYIYDLMPDLELLNDLSRDLKKAVSIFSKMIMVNDYDQSGIDTYDLADLEGGEIIDGTISGGSMAGIGWVSSGVKLNEVSFVNQMTDKIENRVNKQFAGLLGEQLNNFAQPRSATEVSRLISELDAFSAGVAMNYTAQLSQPLAQAYLELIQAEAGGEGATPIKPTIIGGNSQLSRLQELSKFLQVLSNQLQMNPAFTNEVKWKAVWDRMTNGLGIDTDGILLSNEEKQSAQQAQGMQDQQRDLRDQQLNSLRQNQIADNTNEGVV